MGQNHGLPPANVSLISYLTQQAGRYYESKRSKKLYYLHPRQRGCCRRRICDVFSSQIAGGKPRKVCCEEDCNKTVASFSLHKACFECVQASRHGVPCEPPTLCSMCEAAFTEDEAFRKAVVKAKRDRATAKKKSKRSGSPPPHSDTSP